MNQGAWNFENELQRNYDAMELAGRRDENLVSPFAYYKLAVGMIRRDKRHSPERRWTAEQEWDKMKEIIARGAVNYYETQFKPNVLSFRSASIEDREIGQALTLLRDQLEHFWLYDEELIRAFNNDQEAMQQIYDRAIVEAQAEFVRNVESINARFRSNTRRKRQGRAKPKSKKKTNRTRKATKKTASQRTKR